MNTENATPATSRHADLRALLLARKSQKITLSVEDQEEIKIRDEIDVEDKRIAAERGARRKLESARMLGRAKKKAGADRRVEIVDLGEEVGMFAVANPLDLVGETFQDAIRERGHATQLEVTNLVLQSMIEARLDRDAIVPLDPEESANDIRDRFEVFSFAPQSLSNVVLRLGGLVIQEKAKK